MPLINLKQTLFGVCATLGSRGLSKGGASRAHKGFKEGAGSPLPGCRLRLGVGVGGSAEVGSQSHLIVPRGLLASDLYVHSLSYLTAKTRALVSLVIATQDTVVCFCSTSNLGGVLYFAMLLLIEACEVEVRYKALELC